MFAAAPSFGRPFQSRFEAERIVTEIHKIAADSVIDDRMLNYVFFDSGACDCPKEVQERRKKIYLDQMGDEFNFYKHYYQENLSEVNSILQFQLDDFLNDSAFLRTSQHVLANKVFTGCTDFTKAFIQTALDKGYDAESMRVVFLMEQEAYVKSCADRAGQPGRPWTQGGHHVVALKIADQWEVMNTTSPHPEFYLSGLQLPERLNPVNFIQVPMKLIYAGGFDVADYLNAFTFKTIYNIYVSGSPNSNICH
jgi:hypothetical protein